MSFSFVDDVQFLNTVGQVAQTEFTPKVLEIDQGYYPLAQMQKLGQVGVAEVYGG